MKEKARALPARAEVKIVPRRRTGPVKVSLPARRSETPGKYTIQVTAVRKPAKAIRITRRLQDAGFSAFIQRVEAGGNGAWFRIRVGRFSDRQAALKVLGNLRSRASVRTGTIIPF